jgi:DNA repair protein RadA/Sms
VASAQRNVPLGGAQAAVPLVAFGELGLTGELRWVGHPERRIAEARKFGLETIVAPPGSEGDEVATLREALALALPRQQRAPQLAA